MKTDRIYTFYKNIAFELKTKEEYLKELKKQLDTLIYKNGPGDVKAYDLQIVLAPCPEVNPNHLYKEILDLQTKLNFYKNDVQSLIEYKESLENEIKQLAEDMNDLEAKVFYLRHVEGMTIKQIANKLGYSYKHIEYISGRVNKKIKKTSLTD